MRGSASMLGPERSLELHFAVGGRRAPDRCRPRLIGRPHDPRPQLDARLGRGRLRRRLGYDRFGQAGFQDRRRVGGVGIRDATGLKVTAGDQARG